MNVNVDDMDPDGETLRFSVDLNRCQGYAQCVFLAPEVFELRGNEALHFDGNPDATERLRVLRAAASCPVQAIQVEQLDEPEAGEIRMSIDTTLGAALEEFKAGGRIVIVGASLAGLRAAEALREQGFRGRLTLIGDEPYEPYDRPPLSKQILLGSAPADHTKLPRRRPVEAEWRLGVAATGLDRTTRQVLLANGEQVPYDLLLIATGVRARPWFNAQEATLDGVFSIRTRDDGAGLREALAARPAASSSSAPDSSARKSPRSVANSALP